jgi:hypothetical protein
MRARTLAVGAALVVAFAVALVANASASSTYTVTPKWLGPTGTPALLPDTTPGGGLYADQDLVTAASLNGAATAAWINSNDDLSVSSLDPSTGGWSAASLHGVAQPVDDSPNGGLTDAPTVSVAMDAAGDAVVAWYTGTTTQDVDYMYELAGGSWSTPVTLTVSAAVNSVQVVMNGAGDAALTVGYTGASGLPVELVTGGTSGGTFSFGTPAAIIQPSGGKSAEIPQTAIDGAGDVLTTWIESFNSGNPGAYASFEPSGSSPSPATAVGSTDMNLDDGGPTVAMNASGEAVIAWANFASGSDVIEEADATLAQLGTTTGPVFNSPAAVEPNPGDDELFPGVALSADGTTALAWSDGSGAMVDSIIRPAAEFGTTDWSSTQDLQANTSVCSSNACSGTTVPAGPQVAFEQGDNVVLLWAGTTHGAYSVVSEGASYAGLTGPNLLEQGTSNPASNWPYDDDALSLATDGVGDAVATWISQDGGGSNYQAVADEMDGAGTSFNIPATATPNTPVTFTASNPWTWEHPTTTWSGQGGLSGTGDSVSNTYTALGTYTVTATTTDNSGAVDVVNTTIAVQDAQSITFPPPGGGNVGGSETLSATGGASGNAVVFSVDSSSGSGVCSVSGTNGTTVNFAHAGSCVIDANQAGDTDYSAAAQTSQTITVGKGSQSISFTAPGGGAVGGSESLSATGGASGDPVVFSVDSSSGSGVCSVSGTNGQTVSFAHVGSCVVDANQAGDTDYNAAAPASQTITVGKGSQSISFSAPGGGAVGGSESLSATGGASGNPVVFSVDTSSSSPANACSVSGTNGATVSFAHAGSCVIDANQAGNSDYTAAAPAAQTIAVGKGSQSISFPGPGAGTVGGSESLSATGGGSGNAVVFSVDSSSGSGVCSVSGTNGSTVSFAHAGSCVIDANQAGNSDYTAAAPASQTITVGKASQSVSFPAPGAGTVGGSESLSATGGGSGNAVVFSVDSSSGSGVCSVSGTNGATVSFAHAGSCVIDANQAGNTDYSAAAPASQTITVGKGSQSVSFPAPGGGAVGGSESLSATGGTSGEPVVFTVDSSSTPSGACSVSGTNGATVSFAHPGSCVIDANQAGNSDYSAAAPASQTITVGKGSQSVSFPGPGGGTVGGSESLSATGGASGNPVVFVVDSSSGPGVCSVSGTNGATVSFAHAGSCVIDANQAGDTDYNAAAPASQTITVAQGSQAVSFPAPGGGTVGGSESLSATGGASGNPVVFSVDTSSSSPANACSVSGSNGAAVSFGHAGSCVIDANQAGDTDYSAAPQGSRTITVAKGSQAVSFPVPGGGTVGGSESLSATGGGSGNPVVFTVDASSSPSDACSVSGANGETVTFVDTGSCVIDANQAGNSDYSAAAPVSHSVGVSPAATTTTTDTTTTTTPTTTTPTTTIATATASTPPPVLGESSDVSKTSGTVQVELPGTHTFVTVSASEQIPFGAVIDATNGKVTATIALPGGGTSTATFWAGEFTLSQSSSGALTAKLVDGSSAGCPTSAKAAKQSSRLRAAHELGLAKVTKKKPGAVVGSLWTNAKGSYTTSGKNGSAAVLGTEWLTRDQCDGTFFEVTKTSNDPHGEIRVTVLHPRKHAVLLKRGHSLLAPAPGFP